jgi:hypothetical protein
MAATSAATSSARARLIVAIEAAAFAPLCRRVQELVDRRFNRRRYDAARTVERFSGRLRDHVDLDTLSAELLTVVDHTVSRPRRPCGCARRQPHGHRSNRSAR